MFSFITLSYFNTPSITIRVIPVFFIADRFDVPDGYEFHNQVVHFPALILLDPEGKEVFRYIGKNNRDRYSFEQLESKIAEFTN